MNDAEDVARVTEAFGEAEPQLSAGTRVRLAQIAIGTLRKPEVPLHRVLTFIRTGSPEAPPAKEDAPCCGALRDSDGRFPVGYCSPGCVRRPGNWRKVAGR